MKDQSLFKILVYSVDLFIEITLIQMIEINQ